jgi:hypothetical protein
MRIVLAALAVAAVPSLALGQSSTATTGSTKPTATAPASNTTVSQPKSKIPAAAQSGANRGLRYGEGAADGSPIEVKRNR